MKNKRYIIIILIALILPFLNVQARNEEYNVDSYEIEITIDKNNNYQYNENIDVIFNKENVLVTNSIPYQSSDITVNNNYIIETSKEKLIKISSNKNTHKSYNYKYKLNVNNENNLNGYKINLKNNFNNKLNNIHFIINLPTSFNKQNFDFYLNNEHIKDFEYEIEDNKITGFIPSLNEDDIFNITIDYNKLYFDSLTTTSIIISITLVIISTILWYFYGKDTRYKIKQEKNIPKGLSPIDIALIKNGEIKNEDSIYLLLNLANKGYIKITEDKKDGFTIEREKDYDGNDFKEASFYKTLFRKNMNISISEYINILNEKSTPPYPKELVNKISAPNIKNRILKSINNILSIIKSNEEKNKYYEKNSNKKRTYLLFSITIILILITSIPFIKINKLYLLPISVVFSTAALYILITMVENVDIKQKNNKIILLFIFGLIILFIMVFPSFQKDRIYSIAFMIGIISVSIILFLYKYMPKRTIYGTKIMAKLDGLTQYINEIDNEKLNKLLKENPNYLYDILPYSFTLNIEKIIFKKLKELNVPEPTWYKIKDYKPFKLYNSIQRLKMLINNQE